MKKSVLLFVVSLFSVSFCSQFVVADGFFGKKPEKGFYCSLGYLMGTAGTNELVFNSEQGEERAKYLGRHTETEEIPLAGLTVKLGRDISNKIFVEMNYDVGETVVKARSGYSREINYYDEYGHLSPIRGLESSSDYREINIKSSPEISLNCVLLDFSALCLYVGGGIRYVSINGKGDYTNCIDDINDKWDRRTSGSFAFNSSKLNPSIKTGIRFRLLEKISGSVDYTCCPISFSSKLKSVGSFETSLGDGYLQANIGIAF